MRSQPTDLHSARSVALAALRRWRAGNVFADAILSYHLRESDLAATDRAFATELFYGVLRNLSLLDFWIGRLRSGPLDAETRDVLRLGIYQLFVLETPAHAAVYETVELSAPRGRAVANGVLRNALRQKEALIADAQNQPLDVRTSHPAFLIERWTKAFGSQSAAQLCAWNNRPAPLYARINSLKTSRDDYVARNPNAELLQNHSAFVRLDRIPADALDRGECYIQDPSTAASCELLDPQPGETILDACAAPGGKTSYIAALMQNRGRIIACDRDPNRLATLRDNLDRLGVSIARIEQHDWTRETPFDPDSRNPVFDRILVDAPCSNTGVMRRRVDVRWRLTPNDFAHMRGEQLRILRATVPLLKPGGVLVYSTCSLEPEENREVVEEILREFPALKMIAETSVLPFRDEVDGAFAAKFAHQGAAV